MLQLAQRTCAPSAMSVSISTAVWIVIWSDPVTRTPASGLPGAYFSRIAINPGISFSAMEISLRPQSASVMSRTLKSCFVIWVVVVLINLSPEGYPQISQMDADFLGGFERVVSL